MVPLASPCACRKPSSAGAITSTMALPSAVTCRAGAVVIGAALLRKMGTRAISTSSASRRRCSPEKCPQFPLRLAQRRGRDNSTACTSDGSSLTAANVPSPGRTARLGLPGACAGGLRGDAPRLAQGPRQGPCGGDALEEGEAAPGRRGRRAAGGVPQGPRRKGVEHVQASPRGRRRGRRRALEVVQAPQDGQGQRGSRRGALQVFATSRKVVPRRRGGRRCAVEVLSATRQDGRRGGSGGHDFESLEAPPRRGARGGGRPGRRRAPLEARTRPRRGGRGLVPDPGRREVDQSLRRRPRPAPWPSARLARPPGAPARVRQGGRGRPPPRRGGDRDPQLDAASRPADLPGRPAPQHGPRRRAADRRVADPPRRPSPPCPPIRPPPPRPPRPTRPPGPTRPRRRRARPLPAPPPSPRPRRLRPRAGSSACSAAAARPSASRASRPRRLRSWWAPTRRASRPSSASPS